MSNSKEQSHYKNKTVIDVSQPGLFTRLYKWATLVPESISPEHRRAYHVALIAGVVGGLFHLIALVIFAVFNIKPIAYVNIGSVTLFAAAFLLVRRTGLAVLGMVLISIELIIHQVLVVYYLGWGYGYQYYLFGIAGVVFLGHYRNRAVPTILVLLSIIIFGWLYFHGQYLHLPHLSMPETVRIFLFWFNLFSAMLNIAVMSLIYAHTAIRMERELAEQNRQLREAQFMLVQSEKMAAIGKLAAGLTHEINTPIGAILSNTQTGARAVKRLRNREGAVTDAEQRNIRFLDNLDQSLDSTTEAAHRISQLVDRMKSFVQLDKAELKSSDPQEGIESAIALMQDQLRAGPIEVIRHFDPKLPEVLCRPAEINQVLMHLLQNAIDAIKGSGKITITTSHDTENITIAISDTGQGMTPEECESLFDLSFSSKGSRVKLGMGLPISYQIIARHQGELRVESTPGEGTTFTVVLPKQRLFHKMVTVCISKTSNVKRET